MNMEDILNSGANVTLTIKSTDLKEFAEHLVKKTVRSIRDSFIRPEEDYLTIRQVRFYIPISQPYGDGIKLDICAGWK